MRSLCISFLVARATVSRLEQSVVPPTASKASSANAKSPTNSSADSGLTQPVAIVDLDLQDDEEDNLPLKSASDAATKLSLAGSIELDSVFSSSLLIEDLL